MGLDQTTLNKMNRLANAFAGERVNQSLDKIKDVINESPDYIADLKKEIGTQLAIAYSKGYADAIENQDVKRLIF